MATEYKLSYTASEINNKLGKIDGHSNQITEISEDVTVLTNRMNTFTALPEGTTVLDAEVMDARINANGTIFDNLGTTIRNDYQALSKRMNNISLYSLDLVKEMLGTEPIFEGDIEHNHTDNTKQWQFVAKTFNAPAGMYTLIIDDCFISNVGGLSISHNTTGQKFIENITKAGIYTFRLFDVEEGNNERTILLQTSTQNTADVGFYYVHGLHIFKGAITGRELLPEYITGTENCVKKEYGKNLFDKTTITEGYFVSWNGLLSPEHPDYPGFFASDYIPIEAGKSYAITTGNIGAAYVGFYYGKDNVARNEDGSTCVWNEAGLIENGWVITAPQNAKYLRISGKIEALNITQVEKGNARTPYEPFTDYLPIVELEQKFNKSCIRELKINTPYVAEKDILNSGENLTVTTSNSRGGHSISFSGNIEDFNGQLIISNGKTKLYCSSYLVLTNTELKVYFYTDEAVLKKSVAHGLTFNDNIIVDIDTSYNAAKIRVVSSGETFETTSEWFGSTGVVMAELTNITVNNAILSCYIQNLNKDIWVFGDSYIDFWCETVNAYGYDNFMLDGFSGRNSLTALSSFNVALEKATPKKVLWCMGMNDADSDNSVNTNWLSAYNSIKTKCEELNIELIVATIPTTPTRNNNYKNDVIRQSGLRLVDIAKSVGSHISSSWYDELLSSDNVHPTEKGQTVIANYILANVPELKNM